MITKFLIHGKYEVAKKFQELIDSFLLSFDFEQHPQYDLEWYLLTFLLDLSTETHKSNLNSLKLMCGEHSFNTATGNEDSITEEIDWAQYLKEGQENFFCDYKSDDSESVGICMKDIFYKVIVWNVFNFHIRRNGPTYQKKKRLTKIIFPCLRKYVIFN